MSKAIALSFAVLMLLAVPARSDESAGPHQMVKPDGTLDTEKCGACHNEDMSLSRSKLETCTLCHSTTVHSGAAEHLGAAPASVARWLPKQQPAPALPLREDGGIFCGTCHLFHDPAVGSEQPLPAGWVPRATGLPEAVRRALTAQWETVAHKYNESAPGAQFTARSTRALRLPVDDGSLCRRCHGSLVE
jgi:hypothetical protein